MCPKMRTKVTQDRRWKSGWWSLFADMSPGGCSCEVSKRHASPIFFEALSDACIGVAQASAVNRPPDSKAMGVTFKQYQKICILLYTNPQKFGGILCSIFFVCVVIYTIYIYIYIKTDLLFPWLGPFFEPGLCLYRENSRTRDWLTAGRWELWHGSGAATNSRNFLEVPPNHPFLVGIFHYKPSILGYPHIWKPHENPHIKDDILGLTSYWYLLIIYLILDIDMFEMWSRKGTDNGWSMLNRCVLLATETDTAKKHVAVLDVPHTIINTFNPANQATNI